MKLLLENINLDGVAIGSGGTSVFLDFIDMSDGSPKGKLLCTSVYYLKYQNCFEENESFAAFVGEVTYECVEKENISKVLEKYSFDFCEASGKPFTPRENDTYLLHVEGGQVILDIICGKLTLNNCVISV